MDNEDFIQIGWNESSHSIIKVVGVGGGGSNAVNYMFRQGIHSVDFVVCNTDSQALDKSPVPMKVRLGKGITEGLGAGGRPEKGCAAAKESEDELKAMLADSKMVFITAGMGGGTGTGAAPVIAAIAQELGLLTVAIVTIPFEFEGKRRHSQAIEGISKLREHVDALLVIENEKIRQMYGNLAASQAFAKADNVLAIAAKGIAEVITCPGAINVDFADVSTIMCGGGITVMGSAGASGENRAHEAIEAALNSPLLNNSDITNAGRILLNITSGAGEHEVTMDEITVITDFVTASARNSDMIWGTCIDENLGDMVNVTIVATAFPQGSNVIDVPDLHPAPPSVSGRKPTPRGGPKSAPTPPPPPRKPVDWIDTTGGNEGKQKSPFTLINKAQPHQMGQLVFSGSETETDVEIEDMVPSPVPIYGRKQDWEALENEPAIRRKQKKAAGLFDTDQQMSALTIGTDPETNEPRLRENNPYLFDRVD